MSSSWSNTMKNVSWSQVAMGMPWSYGSIWLSSLIQILESGGVWAIAFQGEELGLRGELLTSWNCFSSTSILSHGSSIMCLWGLDQSASLLSGLQEGRKDFNPNSVNPERTPPPCMLSKILWKISTCNIYALGRTAVHSINVFPVTRRWADVLVSKGNGPSMEWFCSGYRVQVHIGCLQLSSKSAVKVVGSEMEKADSLELQKHAGSAGGGQTSLKAQCTTGKALTKRTKDLKKWENSRYSYRLGVISLFQQQLLKSQYLCL